MCVPATKTITISNLEPSEELIITHISLDSQYMEIKPDAKTPLRISAKKNLTLTITYSSNLYGEQDTFIYFTFSKKTYIYKVKAYGIANSFGIEPIFRSTLYPEETVIIPIEITNPSTTDTIKLLCIKSEEQQIKLIFPSHNGTKSFCSRLPAYIIPPMQKMLLFNMHYTTKNPGVLMSHIQIIGEKETKFIIPVILRSHIFPIIISPRLLDFGIIPMNSKPQALRLILDTKFPVNIHGVYSKPNPNLVINLPTIDQPNKIFAANPWSVNLGYIAFYSSQPGIYRGEIYVQTNVTGILELEFIAEVIPKPLFVTNNRIGIDFNNESVTELISVESFLSYRTAITKVETSNKNIIASNFCPHELRKDELSNCISFLNETRKSFQLNIFYDNIQQQRLPLLAQITVLGTELLLSVPVLFYDSSIYCSYYKNEENKNMGTIRKNYVRQKCSTIREIDLGAYGDALNYFELNITKPGDDPITVNHINLSSVLHFACLDAVQVINTTTGDQIENFKIDKYSGFKEGTKIHMDSHTIIIIRLALYSAYCGNGKKINHTDGSFIESMLGIDINTKLINVGLKYQFMAGELNLYSSEIAFDGGFPGFVQVHPFYVKSSFKQPLRIIRITSTDKRISFVLKNKVVNPNSRELLGEIVYNSSKLSDEESLQRYYKKIVNWQQNSITLKELKIWKKREDFWEDLHKKEGLYFSSNIFIETEYIQQIKVPVKAKQVKPMISSTNEITFEMIETGGYIEKGITIYNPLDRPLKIQLFITADWQINPKEQIHIGPYVNKRCFHSPERSHLNDECCYLARKRGSTIYLTNQDHLTEANTNDIINENDKFLEQACENIEIASYDDPRVKNVTKEEDKSFLNWILSLFNENATEEIIEPEKKPYWIHNNFSQAPIILAPGASLRVYPIIFSPKTSGLHHGALLIKNNLTIISPVKLNGKSGSGIIEFTQEINPITQAKDSIQVLPVEINKLVSKSSGGEPNHYIKIPIVHSEVIRTLAGRDLFMFETIYDILKMRKFAAKAYQQRTFIMRNSGNLPLKIKKISIAGQGCNALGFSIAKCENLILSPKEHYKLVIDYHVSGSRLSITIPIIFYTTYGTQTFYISVATNEDVLNTVQMLTSEEKPLEQTWRLILAAVLAMMVFGVCCFCLEELLLYPHVIDRDNVINQIRKSRKFDNYLIERSVFTAAGLKLEESRAQLWKRHVQVNLLSITLKKLPEKKLEVKVEVEGKKQEKEMEKNVSSTGAISGEKASYFI